ncbi:hypothetical protein [Phreatobacter sp.]|uniref:hypothetical protein n=1 Tax=Phreatobacter sp. TaxID=1966341 RepID=UPI003F70B9C1
MASPLKPRSCALAVLLLASAAPAAWGQQGFGFQAGTMAGPSSSSGGPLNLLSPTFAAPALPARPGRPTAAAPAVPPATGMRMVTAPLPLPRPPEAPGAVAAQTQTAQTQAALQPAPQEAAPAPLRPSLDDWPHEESRDRVILPGAPFFRPASTGAEAIAAAAPVQPSSQPVVPAQAVAFAAPVPPLRPDAGGMTMVPANTAAAMTGPQLASAGSVPVTLTRGTATTTVMPGLAAGSMPGARQAITVMPTPASGPQLAALPPAGHTRDWPRYVPGARGTDRNLGIAGERVMPDPGVPLTCLPTPVRRALNDVALRFGPVIVRSTHRGNGRFVRTDAWRGSYHRDCRAADFRVAGNPAAVLAFLRARHELGGIKRYRNGLFHIDNGPRRSW